MSEISEYRFADHVGVDPAETAPVELDWFPLCANFWRPNERYSQGEYIRPNRATGFAYQATNSGGGTSGSREPVWPTTLEQTVTEGSITWTCAASGDNGISPLSNPNAASDPTGLTISGVQIAESTKILAAYAGGADGDEFDAVFTVTVAGRARVGRQRVPIRKR